jgi:hypothetical protein
MSQLSVVNLKSAVSDYVQQRKARRAWDDMSAQHIKRALADPKEFDRVEGTIRETLYSLMTETYLYQSAKQQFEH